MKIKQTEFTKERKKELDKFIDYAFKQGLVSEEAKDWPYEKKALYEGWSEYKSNETN